MSFWPRGEYTNILTSLLLTFCFSAFSCAIFCAYLFYCPVMRISSYSLVNIDLFMDELLNENLGVNTLRTNNLIQTMVNEICSGK